MVSRLPRSEHFVTTETAARVSRSAFKSFGARTLAPVLPSNSRITKESKVFCCAASGFDWSRQVWYLVEVLGRKVAGVGDGPQRRDEWRIDLADRRPVHAVEERVGLDLLDAETLLGMSEEAGRRRVVQEAIHRLESRYELTA